MDTKQPVNFTIEVTRAQIRGALIFSADQAIRYYLNGIMMHVGECGDARLVSTDGHRLAVVKICDKSSATPGEYIIPNEPLKAVKKASRTAPAALFLTIEGDSFRLVDTPENAILCCARLIDGKFPDYQRVVPMPENMSGAPGTFNPSYLADIQKALIELGDKNGFFSMLQNGEACSGLVVSRERGFLAVVMPLRAESMPDRGDVALFMPRAKPRCGTQAFPCEPLQDVTDKRTPEPEPVQASGEEIAADVAARFYPFGELQWTAEQNAQRQIERNTEKKSKRVAGHKLKVGDVLRSSWGYDQTNIDYYEVTRLLGKSMVEIRKIGAQSIESSHMTGECLPRPGHYTGEPMRKTVSTYDGQSVRIASYASACKIEPCEVAGVKVYPVDHWTAYA